jgi:hypothetical protein
MCGKLCTVGYIASVEVLFMRAQEQAEYYSESARGWAKQILPITATKTTHPSSEASTRSMSVLSSIRQVKAPCVGRRR